MITRLWHPTQRFSQSACALLVGAALLGLSGCSSKTVTPTTYMLPSSTPTQQYQQQMAITVSPVRIAGHLDSDGIVMQLNDIEVYQARQHLWAEGISQQLQQQLQQRLALNLPQSQVVSKGQPLQAELPVRDVRVQVTRFQGLTAGDALLTGQWQLLNGSGQLLNQQGFSISTPLEKDGYPALVRALGQSWEQLADDITLQVVQK
ncbi:PqiC family protein [Oceanisphaera pacifica]|uniref:Membrane integrity-associated transporter subunit PqiC n=1 Tax=Oceanisphaera pacifica TaxID=2818389 RepID=A0ABS3NG58_9GAMM|nr:ABC-type transport auxiliary lipoprotein family protein [Oceanisphaera pacifica]MBO1519505.1 membrane integrity-associated transporter subunit PqiC [Oceanisphaera pacifica]